MLTSKIETDWCINLLNACKTTSPKKLSKESMYKILDSKDEKIRESYEKIIQKWNIVNYYIDSLEWLNFYPDENYDFKYTKTFAELFEVDSKRDWVSEVKPGRTVPWHWDVDDMHDEWVKEGDLVRFTVFIGNSSPGHVLSFVDNSFGMVEQGTVIQWNDYRDYHCAANCGLDSFYLYHCLGIKK